MLSLKESIVQHIENEYPSSKMDEDSQFLLGNLVLKKILDSDFYRDNYYISSLCIHNNNTSNIILNAYSSSNYGYSSKTLYTVENNDEYTNDFSFSNIKRYLISNDVLSRIMRFHDIIQESSSSIDEFTDRLIEAHKGDSEFLATISSFDYLFNSSENEKYFLTNEVSLLMHKKGMKKIGSELCKNTISFAHYDTIKLINSYENKGFSDEKIMKDCQKKWIKCKTAREEAISYLIAHTSPIQKYYEQYENEIDRIINLIKVEKPFLFEKAKIEDVTFSFFETQKIPNYYDDHKDYKRSIELEDKFSISKDLLKERGIEISDVYKIPNRKHNSETYPEFEENFHKKMFNQENEISNNISHRFNGFDFWGKGTFRENSENNCYLLAKHKDEVIGFLCFSNSEHIPLIKSVEYVSIKSNFRGMGLAEKMYDNLMYILNHHDYILTTSCYSDDGAKKLPKLKERVKSKYPNLLMMNTVNGDLSYLSKNEQSLQEFKNKINKDFLEYIDENQEDFKNNIKKRSPEILDFFREIIKEVDKNHDTLYSSESNQNLFIEDRMSNLVELVEKTTRKKRNKI